MIGVGVTAREWSWRYATRSSSAPRRVTLDVAAGEVILLSGPSGCGKSSLLAGLAGVLGHDQGESDGNLFIDGESPRAGSGRVGLVLQDPESQTIGFTVGRDVAFGCESLGLARDEIWRRVDTALDAVGIRMARDHPTHHLSGGQKQRLAIAGIVAMEPGLMLLDEPTANLDPEGAESVVRVVSEIRTCRGCTVIVVDHNVHLWRDVVTRVITLDAEGCVVDDNAPFPQERRSMTATDHHALLTPEGVDRAKRSPRIRQESLASRVAVSTNCLEVARLGGTRIAIPDVELKAGEISAVTGPNGSGKTTVALTLGGLLAPVGGDIAIAHHISDGLALRHRNEPWRWPSRELAVRVGNVFQSPESQFIRSRVVDEIEFGLRLARYSSRQARARADEILTRLGLTSVATAHPHTLSGGQQRRLSLAAVLASRPYLVMADEPTFGQDNDTWLEVIALLREAAGDGVAVLVATHDDDLVRIAQTTLALVPHTEPAGERR